MRGIYGARHRQSIAFIKSVLPNNRLSISYLMKNEITYHTYDINTLSDSQRKVIADEVFKIYHNIFYGWSRKIIDKLIMEKDRVLYKLRIFKDGNGESIGFCWINARYINFQGKRYTIFFNAAGLDSKVRKKGLITSFFTSVLIKYVITHPFEKIFSFQRLVNPASYNAWANALYEMYPRRDKNTPPSYTNLVSHLSNVFQYKPVRKGNPFVVRCDNYVKLDLDGDKPKVTIEEKPEIAYYYSLTERDPDRSIVMIFPCNFKNAVMSVSKYLNKNIRRRLQI